MSLRKSVVSSATALGMTAIVASLWTAISCDPWCDRRGCEAVEEPAEAAISRGVAGAVAYESDTAGMNGCFACPLSNTTVAIWSTDRPVLDDDMATAVVEGQSPAALLPVEGRYERPMPVGDYLLCDLKWETYYCVAVAVVEEGVTTVNFHELYGPTIIWVFEPGETSPTETTVFSVVTNEV